MLNYNYLTSCLILSGINPGNISLPDFNSLVFESEEELIKFINNINQEIGNVNGYKNKKTQVKNLIKELNSIISDNKLITKVNTFNFSKY